MPMERNYARQSEAAIKGIILARDGKLHISALMLLRIVDHLTILDTRYYPSINQIHGYYQGHRLDKSGAINYTYSGVAVMLRKLHDNGFLSRHKKSRLVTYRLTPKGEGTLDSMYM